MRILIADESRAIRNIERNVLKNLGHEDVIEAEDGQQALALFQEAPPDLLLVARNMPRMDGLTLVRKIRESNRRLPIIMCSTEAEKSRVIEAVKSGVNNYIVKPFNVQELAEKITQTLNRHAVVT